MGRPLEKGNYISYNSLNGESYENPISLNRDFIKEEGFLIKVPFFKRKDNEKNRRKCSRVVSRNLVAVDLPEREIFNLIDISETGLQFSSSHALKKKEILSLTVNLAEADVQFQVLSQVAWTRVMLYKKTKVYRIGMTFIELSQRARQMIRQLVRPVLKAA